MADEHAPLPDEPARTAEEPLEPAEEPARSRRDDERSLWGLIGIAVLAVIVIVILLLLSDCAGSDQGLGDGRGNKTIERVQGLDPMPGSVSLWLSNKTTLDEALRGAGVQPTDTMALGEGRYILQVHVGSEDAVAEALTSQRGVFDAGRVYEEGATR